MEMETKEGMKKYIEQCSDIKKWILNKSEITFNDLIDGLVENKNRYGYQSCPCRLASGDKTLDRDLMCPCDYAPADIDEFGACFCNLFLRADFYEKGVDFIVVPERRPLEKEDDANEYLSNL